MLKLQNVCNIKFILTVKVVYHHFNHFKAEFHPFSS